MPPQTPKPGGGDWEDRLSEELRNLPPVRAPWYLEAELQRRLRFAERHGSVLPGRMQGIVLAILGVAVLGSAAYFLDLLPLPRSDSGADQAPEHGIQIQTLNLDSGTALRKDDTSGEKPPLQEGDVSRTQDAGAQLPGSSNGQLPDHSGGKPQRIAEPGVVLPSTTDSAGAIETRIPPAAARSDTARQRKDTSDVRSDTSGARIRRDSTHQGAR